MYNGGIFFLYITKMAKVIKKGENMKVGDKLSIHCYKHNGKIDRISGEAIVLDVTVGSGAFMKTPERARELAEAMIKIGNLAGRKTVAIITDMDQPLGFAVGNALEVVEAINTLKGQGPDDLLELCLTLGSQMVILAGLCDDEDTARKMLLETIESGKALDKLATIIFALLFTI